MAKVRLLKDTTTKTVYFNTGYLVSLINKDFLLKQALDIEIHTMATPVTVSRLSSSKHVTNKYAICNIRILGINNNSKAKDQVKVIITRELHIVDELRANALIGNNIIVPKKN
jgi:hypothetical protein